MKNNFKTVTPHAAVIIWNYIDRIGDNKIDSLHGTEKQIVSTLSCISISTSKSKGQPDGTFNLVLAPSRNWVSTITAGSWCCIMMSNDPIREGDLEKSNPNLIKMIGKIETVRVETKAAEDGSRQTLYYVSGVDWGHIFNNIIYVDNLIASEKDPTNQGNTIAIALQKALFSQNNGTPQSFVVRENLKSLISIFGQDVGEVSKVGKEINRLAKSVYNFNMPNDMFNFLKLRVKEGERSKPAKSTQINKILNVVTGVLKAKDEYEDPGESYGFIDPFSLQGQNTFWQILLENSNPVLNEMFCEMRWDKDGGLYFSLYNRIKPFCYKDFNPKAGQPKGLKSYFQLVKRHDIDDLSVISVNAGTNWRDKYNFIEVKPEFQDLKILENWYKQKSQEADTKAFEREGFRPIILSTKQFPVVPRSEPRSPDDVKADFDQMKHWVELMREWYFETHRMLNGTIVMQGTTEYIGVGNNIRFDASLINPTPNLNEQTLKSKRKQYVLAHVENVSHSFSVNPESGARTYTTSIQFVRGIVVENDSIQKDKVLLDKLTKSVPYDEDYNTVNTVSTYTIEDPNEGKSREKKE